MAVITISRELGSGGTDISKKAAKILSYALIDKYLIESVLNQYGLIEFHEVYETATSVWSRYDTNSLQLIKMLNKTILAFASRDNSVILGRGGYVILRYYSNVLNVRIQAPFDDRVRRVMEIEQIKDVWTAEERVKENDRIRNGFIQNYYSVKWDSANWFNLVIDTSRISADMALNWIVDAARELDRNENLPGETTRKIEVDPVLASTITDVLAEKS